jgi:hypothetical protein
VLALPDGKQTDLSSIKKQESYIFKEGKLIKGKLSINCAWSEEDITCEHFSEKPHSTSWIVILNRVTRVVDAMTSHLDGKGNFLGREEFSGVCNKVKQKL